MKLYYLNNKASVSLRASFVAFVVKNKYSGILN